MIQSRKNRGIFMKKHLLFIALLFLTSSLVACTPKLKSLTYAEQAFEGVYQSHFHKDIELVRMEAIVLEFQFHDKNAIPDPTQFPSKGFYYFILIKDNMRSTQFFYFVNISINLETEEIESNVQLEGNETDFDSTFQNMLTNLANILDFFDEARRSQIKGVITTEERFSAKQMEDIQAAVESKFSKS